jgi:hypothetical protein
MSHAMDDREERRLRRALLAAAEQVDPADDGLEQIHARLGLPLPVPLAWFVAVRMRLGMRLQNAFWSTSDRSRRAIALVAAYVSAQGEHGRPSRQAGRSRVPGLRWMRPGVAMGVVVFIVAAGVYMAIEVPQAISTSSNYSPHNGTGPAGTSGSSGNAGTTQTHSSGQPVGSSSGPGATGPGSITSGACATPSASSFAPITGSIAPSKSTKPSQSSSPSPTKTSSSPSPSASSPSPTPSASTQTAEPSSGTNGGTTDSAAPSGQDNQNKRLTQRATLDAYSSPCPSTSTKKPGKKHRTHPLPALTTGASGLLELPAITATEVRTGVVN